MTKQQQYQQTIETALQQLLAPTGTAYDTVLEAMTYAVMNGGKRIRPMLVLEFATRYGATIEDALPFACAVEMIHCYSLIHDDLPCMDDDDLRRGKPSCHKQFSESTALLAGDGLLTKAFELLALAPIGKQHPTVVIQAVRYLSGGAGVAGMIGGQVMDLSQEGQTITVDELSQMHLLKTGALIQTACVLGVLAANAKEEAIGHAMTYGTHLGLAFQIVDDILDVTGTEEELGKPIGSDVSNDKNTYVSLCGLQQAEVMAKNHTEKAKAILQEVPNSDWLFELTARMLTRRN